MVDVRRPPLHVNCRCCLVPHIEPRDKDGNVLELGERPAANADFDKLAEEQYNADARKKGLKRRFKDLATSTRLKYYYQAQKDYEKRTGKPAYRRVSTKTTFKEYFERQPEAFKRAWLGRNRFEAYSNGTLKIDDYLNPNRFYTARVVDLKPATTFRAPTADLKESKENSSADKYLFGFSGSSKRRRWTNEEKIVQQAYRDEARRNFGVDADYSNISPDVARAMNKSLQAAKEKFGTFGSVEKIRWFEDENEDDNKNVYARYNDKEKTIYLRSDYNLKILRDKLKERYKRRIFSSPSFFHPFRHEIGHAIHNLLAKDEGSWYNKNIGELRKKFNGVKGKKNFLSAYGTEFFEEMIAESVAAFLYKKGGFAGEVVDLLFKGPQNG